MSDPKDPKTQPSIGLAGQIVIGVVVLGIGLLFGYLMSRPNASKGGLSMKVGAASLDLNIENDLKSMRELLEKVFKDEQAKREMKALLAEFHGFYSIDDTRIAEEIAKLPPNSAVSRALKELSAKQKGAFKQELKEVSISFPGNPRFSDDEAVVCSGSDFLGQKIYLSDIANVNSITVIARLSRPCLAPKSDEDSNKENIQITTGAARNFLGDRPLNKFERGLAGLAPN